MDLDTGSLRRKVGDEARIIPKKIQRAICIAVGEDLGLCSFSFINFSFHVFFIFCDGGALVLLTVLFCFICVAEQMCCR